jgi:hypothetical protein
VYSSLSVILQRGSQDKSPAGQYLQLKEILLKLGCQQTTCITNKTRDAIKKNKISLTNEIENLKNNFLKYFIE